jgi:antitoxin VapB
VALNIKDAETEQLAREVAALTGESKTGAIRTALRERKQRLSLQRPHGDRGSALRRLLEEEIWPSIPPELLGCAPSKEEREEILGYGPEGCDSRYLGAPRDRLSGAERDDFGRYRARLNFGDCLAYATARLADEPLLCKGDDFSKTNLALAERRTA